MTPVEWAFLAVMIASMVLSVALAPKAKGAEAAKFEDFSFPQPEEGTPQSVFFGDCWSEDWMVLWYGNYRTTAVKASSAKK